MTNISVEFIESADDQDLWQALCENNLFCALYDNEQEKVFEYLYLATELVGYKNSSGETVYTSVLLEYILHMQLNDVCTNITDNIKLLCQAMDGTNVIHHPKHDGGDAIDYLLLIHRYDLAAILMDHGAQIKTNVLMYLLLGSVPDLDTLFGFSIICKFDFNSLYYLVDDDTDTDANVVNWFPLIMHAILRRNDHLFSLLLPYHTLTTIGYINTVKTNTFIAHDATSLSLEKNNVYAAECLINKYPQINKSRIIDRVLQKVVDETYTFQDVRAMLIMLYNNQIMIFDTENTPIDIQININKLFMEQYKIQVTEKIKRQAATIDGLTDKIRAARSTVLPGEKFVEMLCEYNGGKMTAQNFLEIQFD